MASTYTPAGIELIADGEQSGTWGQTTNTNWELVEELATGVASVALTGTTHALSVTDGTSSDGRHAIVKFTGSPGGTCTVTVSPNDMQKIYWIVNASDQSVVMTQGSGGNVTVLADSKKVMYCDGAGAGAAVVDLSQDLDIAFNDNDKLTFGDSADLEIYHDGSNSIINDAGTGNLQLKVGGTTKAELTSTGISVDTISELTAAAGVTIDSVLLKDDVVNATDIETGSISANDGTASATIADSTGVMTIASSVLTTTDINGGTIDAADITVGAGKTLDVSAGTLTLANDQISGDKVEGGTINATTITTLTSTTVNATTVDSTNLEVTNLKAKDGTAAGSIANSTGVTTLNSAVLTTADINGGTIDGVTIGGSSAGAITGTTITGTSFVTSGNMTFGDNDKAIFGAGSDLQIYHDGSHSFITDAGTGDLYIRGSSAIRLQNAAGESYMIGSSDGAVYLRYDDSNKLATTSTGIDVTGTVTADGLTVDGAVAVNEDYNITRYRKADGTTQLGYILFRDNGANLFEFDSSNAGNPLKFYANNKLKLQVETNGDISFYEDTGTTAKFFWDASAESLGIGTSSPSGILVVRKDVNGDNPIYFENLDTTSGSSAMTHTLDFRFNRTGSGLNLSAAKIRVGKEQEWVGAAANQDGYLAFHTTANETSAERMRIDSSGKLLVGKTSADGTAGSSVGVEIYPTGEVQSTRNNGNAGMFSRRGSDGNAILFRRDTTSVGSISVTGSATSYNTSSDYRLKEDWQPMTGSIDRLKALNPVNFAWKVDGSRVDGFLAHEAAEVVPEAVTGEKDAVDAEGNPEYQGIDQSKLVPLLTAALQEAVSKIEALETRIAALEA